MSESAPESWVECALVDLVEILDSQRIPINNKERTERLASSTTRFPYYGATGQVGEIDDYIFNGEAVLLGEDAAPFLDPYKSKAYFASGKYWVNNHAHILRGNGAVENAFLCHQLNALNYRGFVSGTTRLKLTQASMKELPLRVPPLNEQRRIVDMIETLFAQLDKGEEAVRAMQKSLTRYRQSILKAAVTGELTADWRAERQGQLEHGSELLDRILQERREKWEGRGKYKEPKVPSLTDLPELPSSWTWSNMDALIVGGPQNGIYLPQNKYGDGTPIIRIDDFQTDWARPIDKLRKVLAKRAEIELYAVAEGDFIVNRVNSVTHLGKTMLVGSEHEGALFESNMMRMSVASEVNDAYLELYLGSAIGRKRLIANCKHAVNQASINQSDVRATQIPLPPIAEQLEITNLANERLEKTKVLDDWCATELKRSASLRQSILKNAFSGKLVEQDPNDEPASELLARIAAEKAEQKSTKRRKAS